MRKELRTYYFAAVVQTAVCLVLLSRPIALHWFPPVSRDYLSVVLGISGHALLMFVVLRNVPRSLSFFGDSRLPVGGGFVRASAVAIFGLAIVASVCLLAALWVRPGSDAGSLGSSIIGAVLLSAWLLTVIAGLRRGKPVRGTAAVTGVGILLLTPFYFLYRVAGWPSVYLACGLTIPLALSHGKIARDQERSAISVPMAFSPQAFCSRLMVDLSDHVLTCQKWIGLLFLANLIMSAVLSYLCTAGFGTFMWHLCGVILALFLTNGIGWQRFEAALLEISVDHVHRAFRGRAWDLSAAEDLIRTLPVTKQVSALRNKLANRLRVDPRAVPPAGNGYLVPVRVERNEEAAPAHTSAVKDRQPSAPAPENVPPAAGEDAIPDAPAGDPGPAAVDEPVIPSAPASEPAPASAPPVSSDSRPILVETGQTLPLTEIVRLIYHDQLKRTVEVLEIGLSPFVICDKLLAAYLWPEIVGRAKTKPQIVAADVRSADAGLIQQQLKLLRDFFMNTQKGEWLVIPDLDLLVGGGATFPAESREIIAMSYTWPDRPVLAFADPSLEIPEVLAARFSTVTRINGIPRNVVWQGESTHIGNILTTPEERQQITGFDPEAFYKMTAGMNAVQARNAVRFALCQLSPGQAITADDFAENLQSFKATSSARFEMPKVKFEHIGGYQSVKDKLRDALRIMKESERYPKDLQQDIVPHGFLFHGPPGTGKTLFAKAVASELRATVMVISGPEVVTAWVGESERKVRDLFLEARRNAPSVLIFDEFDSLGARRTSNLDGGGRSANNVVAQILTEMDGFRPHAPVLIIGTTNKRDLIDEAFLRPSRFTPIFIDNPDREARAAIAKLYADKFGVDFPAQLAPAFVDATNGFNGDEIRAVFIEAYRGQFNSPPVAATPETLGRMVGLAKRSKARRGDFRAV